MAEDLFDVEPPSATEDPKATPSSVLLRVHLHPGAGRSAVAGRHGDALALRVAPPPQDDRANAAAEHLLAELFSLPAGAVELVSGSRGREKRFRLRGVEPEAFRRQLEEVIEEASRRPGAARGRRGSR